jgi:NAD(P)H-dependent flavin oxidoreductase YrpB (nitropropane dioxygenase family)
MLGGMGTNISTAELALAVERLGGIAHLSDAMLMDLSDLLAKYAHYDSGHWGSSPFRQEKSHLPAL